MKMMVTAFNSNADRLAALERTHAGVQFVVPDDPQAAPALMGDVDALFG